jgi:hypothetical protein
MKRTKQLTFQSWITFTQWYIRMKQSFNKLCITFLHTNKKVGTISYFIVITY